MSNSLYRYNKNMKKKSKNKINNKTKSIQKETTQPIVKIETPYKVRNTTLNQRAKFLYIACMSSIAIGNNESDIIRLLANFKQASSVLKPSDNIDNIILDILYDIALEQGITDLTNEQLLMALKPQSIKLETGKVVQTYPTLKQIKQLSTQFKKLHKKAL